MKKQFDLKFAARKYTTAEGQERTYWSTHGSVWVDDEKQSITVKIDSLPVSPNWEGYMRAFPSKPRENQQKQKPSYEGLPMDDEEIPF